MAGSEEYRQKLKYPRWQKKRLEIFERDGWACKWCKSTTRTRCVHHLWYEPGKEPWEAPEDSIITLCEPCHEYKSMHRPKAEEVLFCLLKYRSTTDLQTLAWLLIEDGEMKKVALRFVRWLITPEVKDGEK